VVIGIRSIGTSLSAAVAATLQAAGCEVQSFTVRPRGHPFNRYIEISGFDWEPDSHFLIVDEGPGLSGSSFAAVARKLGELGVPDRRIILFPSWDADGSTFLSSEAGAQWRRHRRYIESRDPFPQAIDLSAGRWRGLCSISPAVQPQHERRKYLLDSNLLKFEGLGNYGQAKFDRAQTLWEAGFAPRPLWLNDGYLASEFVPAEPVREATAELMEWMSRYLDFMRTEFPSDRPVPYEENLNMMRVNVQEALGTDSAARLETLERYRSAVCDSSTVAIDGRMLPYEFVRTDRGYLKTDALDHYDDHFFPGCQDIAWDMAAVCAEFGSYDFAPPHIQSRMPFYLLAYLSYRLGYCSMAANSGPDATKFRTRADQYASRLEHEIDRLC
jgi:hypothetical protein